MIIEVRHLRLVRAIAEEGGPTRAATRLHITQSAVSHQLAELEHRLGVQLFSRDRKQLRITAAGTSVLEAARRLLGELDQLERDVRRGSEPRRRIRVCVESFTSYGWLPTVATGLAAEHPSVELQIAIDARRDPIAALVADKLDLAIVSTKVRARELVTVPLGDDEWCVIVGPKHPLATKSWVSARDLQHETLLVHDAPKADVERLRDVLVAERTPLPRTVKVPLTEALVDLVSAGRGVGLLSRWVASSYERRRQVVARRFTRAGLSETWFAVYRRADAGQLPLECVASLLRRELG